MITIGPVSSAVSFSVGQIAAPETRPQAAGTEAAPGDRVEISAQARQKAKEAASSQGAAGLDGLTGDQRREVAQLNRRDQEVRTHEAAHIAAGGTLVLSGPSYTYRPGPDGKRYAVGGEVAIDTTPVDGDPRATIAKAEQIRRAALAPAQPSGQDLAVASQATAMAANAQRELVQKTPESMAMGADA